MMLDAIKSLSKRQKVLLMAFLSLVFNITYGLGNAVLGILSHSWWFLTVAAYYIILSIMRFAVVLYEKKNRRRNRQNEIFIKRFSGLMFLFLSIILTGTVFLTVKQDIGTKFHEVVMITIATYTFTKIVFAIIKLCKSKQDGSPLLTTVRNISLADAVVSVFSLQRSMLTSFEGMAPADIRLFNVLTGSGVCLVIIVLGLNLMRKDTKNGKNENR
ncbi:MAG: hypothetical protein IJF61_02370 [Clostridia bacterium]|nr:hypothetical protein [Clostridia bacterium]